MLRITLTFFAICLTGCLSFNTDYFYVTTKTKLETSNIDIKSIQFYNSNEIKIRRSLGREDIKTSGGNVIYENGGYYDEIVIKEGTPCVLKAIGADELTVQFEEGVNKTFIFQSNTKTFRLKIDRGVDGKSPGSLNYDGTVYQVIGSGDCLLTYKKADVSGEKSDQKVLGGLTVK